MNAPAQLRVLKNDDAFCPKCGHNRDASSSVSSIDEGDGLHSCEQCGAQWLESDLLACGRPHVARGEDRRKNLHMLPSEYKPTPSITDAVRLLKSAPKEHP